MSKVEIIAIAGLSCSGKTTLAQEISLQTGAPVLSLDDYYLPLSSLALGDRKKLNYDAPEMFDQALLYVHLTSLLEGRPIEVPTYDFVEFTRGVERHRVESAPLIVLEGQYAIYWNRISELCSTRVFLDVPVVECLERRLLRDTVERGRTEDDVRWRFDNHVLPMYQQHMAPSKEHATVHLCAPYDVKTEAMRLVDRNQSSAMSVRLL